MGQSLHVKYGHIIFSTKNRERLIDAETESDLYDYIGGIIRKRGGRIIEINGTEDHIHILLRESKDTNDQDFIGHLKAGSSTWLNENQSGNSKFKWQAGYGWFSVSPVDLEKATAYILKQKAHHQNPDETFQSEFRRFLTKYQVNFDERFVWD